MVKGTFKYNLTPLKGGGGGGGGGAWLMYEKCKKSVFVCVCGGGGRGGLAPM